MKMMGTSWNKDYLVKIRTMIAFDATMPGAAVARPVLIGSANKKRERAQCNGDQAIGEVASRFAFQKLTVAGRTFILKEGVV
jgi:hypothetical protein